ncbi:MAG: mechanosensitive ion channel protein, partial [Pseudomonas sp.]
MLNLKTVLLLGTLLFCGSGALQAATAPVAPAPAAPAQPELLVEGGLLGAISSSIDDVQDKLDLNQNLVDAWRLRADRAADEVDKLVNQPSERSSWSVAGDFLLLSGVWIGAFAALTLLGRFIVKRLSLQRHIAPRQRLQALLGYLIPYAIPALICLPLTL